eukprot:g10771.t1
MLGRTQPPSSFTNEGWLIAIETPLGLANRALRGKRFAGKPVNDETPNRLEAVRRMLERVEAIHAVSWLWPGNGPRVDSSAQRICDVLAATTNGTSLTIMLPMMRRRAARRGMVW